MTLSETLRAKRKELKLTTKQVADAVGKKQRAYEYYEDVKDPTTPDIETLLKLSELLQFDLNSVYNSAAVLQKSNFVLDGDKEPKKTDISNDVLMSLIDTNKILAISNEKLADANQRQTRMLESERRPAGFPEEIVEAFGSTIQHLQEVLAEVAVGKRFQDKKEVAAALMGKADTSAFQKAS